MHLISHPVQAFSCWLMILAVLVSIIYNTMRLSKFFGLYTCFKYNYAPYILYIDCF